MTNLRPFALSIAGFDPSGGAGLLADIKTLEANHVYGLGVCTGVTFQNDIAFERVNWLTVSDILDQCRLLFDRFRIDFVKIGLIKKLQHLPEVIVWLRRANPDVKIVWDPVMKASAGYAFHQEYDKALLQEILSGIDLLTPNLPEMQWLSPASDPERGAEELSQYCPVYLKGGHQSDHGHANRITDVLFTGSERHDFHSERIVHGAKHGSGCVLSSAILAQWAKGAQLTEACRSGRGYTVQFLSSNPSLLGYHY